MPKVAFTSKAPVAALVVLSVFALASVVTVLIVYRAEIFNLNPTTRAPRLPRNLVPHHYKVFLQPYFSTRIDPKAKGTDGNELILVGNFTVSFRCVETTSTILLHNKDVHLSMDPPVVRDPDTNQTIGISAVKKNQDESSFLEIQLNDVLEAGRNYTLFHAFGVQILDNLEGLYVISYVEGQPADEGDKTTERYLVATNMEPTGTRGLFPCFDEPDMKAVFDVTIIHPRNTTALANGQMLESNILDDDWQYTSFHSTPKMSTYLFAIAVSEFTSTPTPHERVEINTFARPNATAAGHTQYAANITGNILTFYETYLGSNYQLNKLDQIALPDLAPAAMENWGLITYHEDMLLYEEGVTSVLHKEAIANIIAHELAHQWFGNLVTMKWWNEIWLNEGFASYMSSLAVDHVEPTFDIGDRLFFGELLAAFEVDAEDSSRPLRAPSQDVQTTPEIMYLFDTITYNKGSCVLRMLADIVEERVFNKGVKMYLSEFKNRNVDQNDLFEYIQKAVDEENGLTKVSRVMDPWTKQSGYPIITINTTNGEIHQKRFMYKNSSESSPWWYVPIRVMSETSHSFVMLETNGTVKKDELMSKSGEWILANVNCTGFYRVNYNPENWQRLLTQLEKDPHRIPVLNRAQLIDDAFNLARANVVDLTLALNTTRFLRNDRAYLPWKTAVDNLAYTVKMLDRSEVYGPMQAYLQQQVKGLYNFFGNDTDVSQVPEDYSLRHIWLVAIEVACSNGLPECIAMATKMFADWMNNGTNNVHPELRHIIYCQAVAAGGRKEWEFAWKKSQNTRDPSEKTLLSRALSCTKKIWLLNRYLEYTLDPEKISVKDSGHIIHSIAQNVAGQALVWNFIRAHWEYVSKGNADQAFEGATNRFSTQYELDELKRFASDYNEDPVKWTVDQAIKQTKVNIQWVSQNKDNILKWFEGQMAS